MSESQPEFVQLLSRHAMNFVVIGDKAAVRLRIMPESTYVEFSVQLFFFESKNDNGLSLTEHRRVLNLPWGRKDGYESAEKRLVRLFDYVAETESGDYSIIWDELEDIFQSVTADAERDEVDE